MALLVSRSSVLSAALIASLAGLSSTGIAQSDSSAQGTTTTQARHDSVPLVNLKPSDGKLADLLKREVKKAKAAGRTPFVEIGATWCGPCKKLEAALGDSLMTDAFAGTYIIHLDLDAWKKDLTTFGLTSPAVPVFFAIDSVGHAIGPKIDGGAWGEDIPQNMAPPLRQFFQANLKKKPAAYRLTPTLPPTSN